MILFLNFIYFVFHYLKANNSNLSENKTINNNNNVNASSNRAVIVTEPGSTSPLKVYIYR